MKHAANLFSPRTRSSFKTVYEDSGTEGGPILCQRVFHQLFNPPPSKVVFQFTSSTILRITTVFFLDFFWGVDLISVGDTLVLVLDYEAFYIFLCPATRGSFKTVYEDSDAEGGPILCQRVLSRLFKPSVW